MGEKFNAPDPGATQPTTTDEAGQKKWLPANFKTAGGEVVGPPADDPGAGPDATSRNFEKVRNDYQKVDNPKSDAVQRGWPIKMQNLKSDSGEGVGPPADDPGYEIKSPRDAQSGLATGRLENDTPTADAKSVDSYMKLEHAKSDPGAGPDAASSKEPPALSFPDAASSKGPSGGYDVKKQDRI